MSIANYSVVGRILATVQQGPPVGGLMRVERLTPPGALFEWQRTQRVFEPPFATSFHFWAHGLRAFLERAGREDLFEAVATHALCEIVDGPAVAPALAALRQRLAPASDGLEHRPFRLGYRMLDQEVLCSWVAERDDELLAFFWTRLDWLATAAPYHLEEREEELEEREEELGELDADDTDA